MIESTYPCKDGFTGINTYAIDDIHDSISFYRKGDFLTDDGYFKFQTECAGWTDSGNKQADDLLELVAKNYGCKYENDELMIERENHDEALERLTQCATAITSMIWLERCGVINIRKK